ncbi:MipA/OmpV family protein [Marinobacter hydrocarbonoclasticus]|nr:MipA/OmpV family protein [Marinobacter nauticus]
MSPGLWATQSSVRHDEFVAIDSTELSISFGVGEMRNPIAYSSPVPLFALPSFRYYGQRFYLENLDMGFSLAEQSKWQLDLIGRPSLEALYYMDQDGAALFASILNGVRPSLFSAREVEDIERRFSYLGGARIDYFTEESRFGVQLLTDLTGVHNGQELRLEAEHYLDGAAGGLAITLGARLLSTDYTSYYYALRQGDLPFTIPAEHLGADAAINPYLRLDYHYPLNQDVALIGHWYLEDLDDALTDGLLIDASVLSNWFVGLHWRVL